MAAFMTTVQRAAARGGAFKKGLAVQSRCRQRRSVVRVAPAPERVGNFAAIPAEDFDQDEAWRALRRAERIGHTLAPGKRGPKKVVKQGVTKIPIM